MEYKLKTSLNTDTENHITSNSVLLEYNMLKIFGFINLQFVKRIGV